MKKILLINTISILNIQSQQFFHNQQMILQYILLTCGPGTETYSIYGHSALRIVIPEKHTDTSL